MKKAYCYVRVSSKSQDTARQESELKEYAKGKGFKIIQTFEDVVSASKEDIDNRISYNKLLKLVQKDDNEIKDLFIHEISRLGRKM